MLKKRAQGLSITTIIVAIIALIVIVVVVSIFTGRLNIYSSSVNELTTCENTCKNIGYGTGILASDFVCGSFPEGRIIPGTFSDVTGSAVGGDSSQGIDNLGGTGSNNNQGCCCYNPN